MSVADVTPSGWVKLHRQLEELEAENARHRRKIEHLEVALAAERAIPVVASAKRSKGKVH